MIFDLRDEHDVALVRRAVAGQVVGLTSGSFDLFHHLHLVFLQRCRMLCDVLIVGVDSNDLVRQRKGEDRPLVPEHQRVAIVSALSCVTGAFVLGTVEDFGRAVEELGVNVVFKNGDFQEEEVLGRESARVVIIPDIVQPSSTTQLVAEIRKRNAP